MAHKRALRPARVARFGGGAEKRYYLALHLRFGRTLRIARLAKEEAVDVLPLIQGFIKIELAAPAT